MSRLVITCLVSIIINVVFISTPWAMRKINLELASRPKTIHLINSSAAPCTIDYISTTSQLMAPKSRHSIICNDGQLLRGQPNNSFKGSITELPCRHTYERTGKMITLLNASDAIDIYYAHQQCSLQLNPGEEKTINHGARKRLKKLTLRSLALGKHEMHDHDLYLYIETLADITTEYTLSFISYPSLDQDWKKPENYIFGPNSPYPTNGLLDYFSNYYFQKSLEDINHIKVFHERKALQILDQPAQGEEIPHTTHRIWLNPATNAPDNMIEKYGESIKNFPNYKHIFWCLDKSKLQKTIAKLKTANPSIEVKEVREIADKLQAKNLFFSLIKQGYYVMACDILRLNILVLYGGLYTDFGYSFEKPLDDFLDKFDFMINQQTDNRTPLNTYCDTNIIACKKGDRICTAFLNFLENSAELREITRKLAEPFKMSYNLPNPYTHGPYFSAFLFSMVTPEDKLFLLPGHNDTIKKIHMASWIQGKFGNKSISKNGYPLIEG